MSLGSSHRDKRIGTNFSVFRKERTDINERFGQLGFIRKCFAHFDDDGNLLLVVIQYVTIEGAETAVQCMNRKPNGRGGQLDVHFKRSEFR